MTNLINIQNYESFYLDYLEDNLSENDKRAFELFLQHHPELKLEEEQSLLSNTTLTSSTYTCTNELRNKIKVFDEEEEISENNIEQFIIAFFEKQLTQSKNIELKKFISSNPKWENTLSLYSKTILPTEFIKYPSKEKLKKSTNIYIYYTFSAIAALVILLILLYPLVQSDVHYSPKLAHKTEIGNKKIVSSFINTSISENKKEKYFEKNKYTAKHVVYKINNLQTEEIIEEQIIQNLKTKELQFNENQLSNQLFYSKLENFEVKKTTENKDNSYLTLEEMDEPLNWIINPINKKLNTDIALKNAKPNKNKQGGFYLKIGNFEFLRKTKSTSDVIASNTN